LKDLDLGLCSGIKSLPSEIGDLQQLTRLNLGGCELLDRLPGSIGQLSGLQDLDLGWCRKLTSLPSEIDGLQQLTRLNLGGCELLDRLPGSIGQLSGLQHLDLAWCKKLTSLPSEIGGLQQLTRLNLWNCTSLDKLPGSIGQLSGLQVLCLVGCIGLKSLPSEIGGLQQLTLLYLTGCEWLVELPGSIGQLSGLQDLELGWCSRLTSLPSEIGGLQQLTRLYLGGCESLVELSSGSIDGLSGLKHLSLASCHKLEALPESSRALHLCTLDLEDTPLLKMLGSSSKHLETSQQCRTAINKILNATMRRRAVLKLAREQQTILTSLERMSWLVLLLATTTFLAFLQPPGGFDDQRHQVLISSPAACRSSSTKPVPLVLPAAYQDCALFLFFMFDTLSFCFSLGCVMVIVVLSMPRIQYEDQDMEAGRFWWLLLCTWVLLFLAVAFGFAAFTASAVAMFEYWEWLVALLLPGGVLLVLGGVLMVKRLFSDIFPGCRVLWRSLVLLCSCGSQPLQPPKPEDVEMGKLIMSNEFWGRATAAMKGAFNSSTRSYLRLIDLGSGSISQAATTGAGRTGVGDEQQVQAQQLPAADVQQPGRDAVRNSIRDSSSKSNDHPMLQQLRSSSKGLAAISGALAAGRSAAEPEIQPLLEEP
jgi:Leucine-rich repeat (LRR) protein